jgi:hypothetical protein
LDITSNASTKLMKVVDFPTDFAMAKTDSIEIVHRDLWWEVFTVGKDLDPAMESRTLCNSSRERLARHGHLMGINFPLVAIIK